MLYRGSVVVFGSFFKAMGGAMFQAEAYPVDPVVEVGATLVSIVWSGNATYARGHISWRIGERGFSTAFSLADLEKIGASGMIFRRGSVAFHRSLLTEKDHDQVQWALKKILDETEECLKRVRAFNISLSF